MTINIQSLIDEASAAAGSSGALAKEMGIAPARISEWRAGKYQPDARRIAYMAKRTNRPVLETVAEIESQLDERNGGIWREALEKLRSAGIAAGVLLVIGISSAPTNSHANQRVIADANNAQVYTLSYVRSAAGLGGSYDDSAVLA